MLGSIFTWLKSTFTFKPVVIGQIRPGADTDFCSGSCKCQDTCAGSVACSTSCAGTCAGSCSSAPVAEEVVAPVKKPRKPRTPKVRSDK